MAVQLLHQEGTRLAHKLRSLRADRPIVLGIPRGGVLIADTIARTLEAPLDVLIAGKVIAPGGVAIAGVAEGGALCIDDGALVPTHLPPAEIERLVDAERARQVGLLERIRGTWPLPALTGRTVIVVDDAVITGLTIRAAIAAVQARGAGRVIAATPLCSTGASVVLAAGAYDLVRLESLPTAVAARVHDDERARPCPPLGDGEIHDLIVRELRDIGADPFGGLAIDGV